MRSIHIACWCVVLSLGKSFAAKAAESAAAELLSQARAAYQKGNTDEALALATKAIAAEAKNSQGYLLRGQVHEANRRHAEAVADFDQVLKLDPRAAAVYQHRGFEQFKLGHFTESIADFDKFIQLVPEQAPHHWQRGISLYYAGRFAEGRKQFESHQTVNPNDVENAVWHFLCTARTASVEKARAALIPIQGDTRVPMKEVHALFAGKAKPEEVLAAAKAGSPTPARLNHQLFYAHLYLGLYYEAIGDEKLAREYIFKAEEQFKDNDYMGEVARVHAEVFRKAEKK